jgi:uroporphyrin-III C-methyltransferase
LTPEAITLVILMGMARRATLAAQLIERGWPAQTAAAIVSDGSRPGQQVWRGTLDDLAAERAALDGDAPAVIVIGDVAALRLSGGLALPDAERASASQP